MSCAVCEAVRQFRARHPGRLQAIPANPAPCPRLTGPSTTRTAPPLLGRLRAFRTNKENHHGLKIVTAQQALQVQNIITVIYGDPGIGKTSLASSASRPILFDFDLGAHRAGKFRKDVVQVTKVARSGQSDR